jgi:hypothetical protein
MKKHILMAALLAVALPAPIASQSLLNAAGLGLPVGLGDARARALGGVGIGLQGPALLGSDPAAAARFVLPSVVMTAQPTWVDFGRSDTGESGQFRGTRFPTLGVVYPAWNLGMVTLSIESMLDQRFEAERPITLQLLNESAPGTDHFTSEGGVSVVRVGLARALGENARVGLSVGRYTGSSVRRLVRTVSDTVAFSSFESFQDGGRWSYSGTSVTGGASVTVAGIAELGGSVTWSGGLDATASEDTQGADRSYDFPWELRVGASALLAPGLSLVAGMTRADWSDIDDDLSDGASVGSASTFGVGVELTRARLLGRSAPIRLGYSRRDLPFALSSSAATESAWTGGLGLRLDLAIEMGIREDGTVTEDFWRASLTLRVSGF